MSIIYIQNCRIRINEIQFWKKGKIYLSIHFKGTDTPLTLELTETEMEAAELLLETAVDQYDRAKLFAK